MGIIKEVGPMEGLKWREDRGLADKLIKGFPWVEDCLEETKETDAEEVDWGTEADINGGTEMGDTQSKTRSDR